MKYEIRIEVNVLNKTFTIDAVLPKGMDGKKLEAGISDALSKASEKK